MDSKSAMIKSTSSIPLLLTPESEPKNRGRRATEQFDTGDDIISRDIDDEVEIDAFKIEQNKLISKSKFCKELIHSSDNLFFLYNDQISIINKFKAPWCKFAIINDTYIYIAKLKNTN